MQRWCLALEKVLLLQHSGSPQQIKWTPHIAATCPWILLVWDNWFFPFISSFFFAYSFKPFLVHQHHFAEARGVGINSFWGIAEGTQSCHAMTNFFLLLTPFFLLHFFMSIHFGRMHHNAMHCLLATVSLQAGYYLTLYFDCDVVVFFLAMRKKLTINLCQAHKVISGGAPQHGLVSGCFLLNQQHAGCRGIWHPVFSCNIFVVLDQPTTSANFWGWARLLISHSNHCFANAKKTKELTITCIDWDELFCVATCHVTRGCWRLIVRQHVKFARQKK